MAIKKVLINSREWHYALVTQHDGSIAVVVTKPDGSTQALTVTDVQYSANKKTIQFMCNGQRFSMRITHDDQHHIICPANGKTVAVTPIAPKKAQLLFLPANQETVSVTNTDLMTVKSPLAGRITKVLVAVGQSVTKGQPLLLIESMKMENEICSPSNGSIQTISIQQGEVVKPHQVLLILI
jgi:biotin carboxyl carrier protein